MRSLQRDAGRFARYRQEKAAEAGQRVALSLLCGLDLEDVMTAGKQEKLRLIERVGRLLERERLKGLRRHWSSEPPYRAQASPRQAAGNERIGFCGPDRASGIAQMLPSPTGEAAKRHQQNAGCS